MGELHLEIVEERLRRVYGVECELGELQVAYKEGLAQETGTRGDESLSCIPVDCS